MAEGLKSGHWQDQSMVQERLFANSVEAVLQKQDTTKLPFQFLVGVW